MENLPNLLDDFQTHPTSCYDFARLAKEEDLDLSISSVKWGVLTAAALVDSVNPCAIAVLLILLGGLVMSTVPPANEESNPSGDDATNKSDSGTPKPDQRDSNANESSIHDIEDAMDSATGGAPEQVDEINQEAGVIEATCTDSPEESDIHADGKQTTKDSTPKAIHDVDLQSRRRRAFFCGMAFITSVFIAYYLLGFGLFSAVSSTNASR
jgi:hypothetical protein